MRKRILLSPICTSETEDLGQVMSDEEQKKKESLQYAVTLELLCKELGEKGNYLFSLFALNSKMYPIHT